jgi:oligopeptide transport system substrate-binding protein
MNFPHSAPNLRSAALFSFLKPRFIAMAPAPGRGSRENGIGLRFVAIFFFCVLGLTPGCKPFEPKADLVIINNAEPESLDPAQVTGQSEMRVVSALFEGLCRYNAKTGEPEPALSDRWRISEDGRTYTFHIREGLRWSTGEPISSADFLYSWRRILAPETAADYAGQFYYIKNAEAYNTGSITNVDQVGISAPDPSTFQVVLNQRTPFFLNICALQMAAVVPRKAIEAKGDHWILSRPLPVSGAYELASWRINDKIRLRRNDRYWDAGSCQNTFVDLLPVGSASVALNLYETGGTDIVWDKELIPAELLEELQKRPDFHTFDYLGSYFVRFNVTRKPFDDARVRRAFALSVDKERILRKIVKTGGKIASALTPSGIRNYTPPEGLGYNPAFAKKLLAEAGYPDGANFPTVTYMFNYAAGAVGIHEKIAVEMQQMWREELGVRVDLRRVESKIFYGAQSALDYDFSRSSWIGDYNDPTTFLDLFRSANGNNRTGWKNRRYDELLDQANAEADSAKRNAMLQQAEALLVHDEVPILPLYYYVGINYFDSTKITGIYNNVVDVHPIHLIHKSTGSRQRAEGGARGF